MVNIRLLNFLFEKKLIFKAVFYGSLFGIIPLLDFYLIFKLGYLVGNNLALAILALLTGIGIIILNKTVEKNIDTIHVYNLKGYAEEPFVTFIGTIPAAILLIFPGLISTFIGLILLLPYLRILLGNIFTKRLDISWIEIHEYFYILYK